MEPERTEPVRPRRKSRWERERSEWYREAARNEVVEGASWLLWFLGLGGAAVAMYGFSHVDDPKGWAAMVASALCAMTLWGLLRGKAWARWVGGAVALVLLFVQLVSLVLAFLVPEAVSPGRWAMGLAVALLWGAVVQHLIGPGSRERFRRAREGEPSPQEP